MRQLGRSPAPNQRWGQEQACCPWMHDGSAERAIATTSQRPVMFNWHLPSQMEVPFFAFNHRPSATSQCDRADLTPHTRGLAIELHGSTTSATDRRNKNTSCCPSQHTPPTVNENPYPCTDGRALRQTLGSAGIRIDRTCCKQACRQHRGPKEPFRVKMLHHHCRVPTRGQHGARVAAADAAERAGSARGEAGTHLRGRTSATA